ncbi:MAG: HK97 family phage prohead protease [Chloroflexota bacterium]
MSSQYLIERRFVDDVEMRVDKDGRIEGYAAVFNEWSQNLGGFRERVAPGAFTNTLAEGADVRALFNHDPNVVLGRRKSKTLEAVEDSRGLQFRVSPPQTRTVEEMVLEPIRRGDVSGASFDFRVRGKEGDHWWEEEGWTLRELRDVDLREVGPVTYPAYTGTDVQVRSLVAIDSFLRSARPGAEAGMVQRMIEQLQTLLAETESQADDVSEAEEATRAQARLVDFQQRRRWLELAQLV